jgi:L-rhamnose isomerase/sugar isomerase
MIDQSHNLKGKIEAMVQTVVTAQELWLKAALVDREQLAELAAILRPGGRRGALPRRILDRCAPARRIAWREARGLPADPLAALRQRLCGAHRPGTGQPPLGRQQLRLKRL